MSESKNLNIWVWSRNTSLTQSQRKGICNFFFSLHSAERCLGRGGMKGGPGCATSLGPCPVGATTRTEQKPAVFPPKPHTVYREPWWGRGLQGGLLCPAERVSGSPVTKGWQLGATHPGAGRLQSGVNRDEGWQRDKPCVFSQGGVFSPLSGAQAIQAVCVFSVSAWDTSHLPCCSASQGKPRKGSGCSSTIGSSELWPGL